MRLALVLHGGSADVNFALLIFDERLYARLFVFGSECANDVVCIDFDFLFGEFVLFAVEEVLLEFDAGCYSIVFEDFGRGEVGDEVYAFVH
jgi:hypothetical protein